MAGMATVTMLPSRMVISPAAESTASAVQREFDMVFLPKNGFLERDASR
jgi:hypothetical protein